MVDPRAVRLRLREVDRRIGRLRRILEAGREAFLGDPEVQAAAERHLQVAIQGAIDAGAHLVAEASAETPADYAGVFAALARMGVIDGGLAERLARAARLRNLLVHLYLQVDPERLWEAIGQVGDLEALAAAVERHLGPGRGAPRAE